MAYGSGWSTPYFCLNVLKNVWPAGGYWSGGSVATVQKVRESSDVGMPPSFGLTHPALQRPSGPNSLAFGPSAAAKSFVAWTPLLAVMPANRKQSAPALLAFWASER